MTASLEDDERSLREHGDALVDAVADVVGDWIRRSIARHAPDLAETPAAAAAVAEGRETIVAELGDLVTLDVDAQPMGPLQVLRNGVRFATAVLRDAGVPPVARDEFAVSSFPDDGYDLSPASFADVDPSLHEPGIVWGAAKAHVHLRRRRASAGPAAVALSVDLMDRSKLSGSLPDVVVVRTLEALIEVAGPSSLSLVDLARVDDPAVLAEVPGRVIAYASHVDDDVLAAATAAGAEALPRSVFFRRLATGDL